MNHIDGSCTALPGHSAPRPGLPPPVDPIRSERLDLVSLSPEFLAAIVEGDRQRAGTLIGLDLPGGWLQDDERFVRLRLEQMRKDPSARQWLIRAMVLRAPRRRIVGHIGFHGSPDARGAVEVGYTVEPDHRRQGYALEAVEALFEWAWCEHGISHFVASVSPRNDGSLALVRKLGFRQTGSQWDEEDGEELVFELHRD